MNSTDEIIAHKLHNKIIDKTGAIPQDNNSFLLILILEELIKIRKEMKKT